MAGEPKRGCGYRIVVLGLEHVNFSDGAVG